MSWLLTMINNNVNPVLENFMIYNVHQEKEDYVFYTKEQIVDKSVKPLKKNKILEMNRTIVNNDYESAEVINNEKNLAGNVKYGECYIYENQKKDALNIISKFYQTDIKVVSVLKRTKLGMDGLMIEISKLFATHDDDEFAVHRDNIFIITGMSNILWEEDMKEKIPNCFKNNVYHHGKLEKLHKKLKNVKNAVLIVDEIDTGDKKSQRLHTILKNCGLLDLQFMKTNNIKFVFVSATSFNQLHELQKWGDKYHSNYNMTIPDNYIGHSEFVERGIIQEFYPINSVESSTIWIKTDIINNYASDYRIHIIRIEQEYQSFLQTACIQNDVDFRSHSCEDRIEKDELEKLFGTTLTKHLVIAIKGLYRRANYIPNEWKMKIGATHERFTAKYDTSVQIQGLPGRMTGYWKKDVEEGHKTGPYRTSISAMNEYEEFYKNPTDDSIKYKTHKSDTFVSSHFIKNLDDTSLIKNNRVPVIISIIDDITKLKKKGELIEYIKKISQEHFEDKTLYEFISNNKCLKIIKVLNDKDRNNFLTDIEDAHTKNIPYNIEIPNDIKGKNCWQIYVDGIHKRLYIIICCIDNSY